MPAKPSGDAQMTSKGAAQDVADHARIITSEHAQELLGALIGFIQPIIHTHVSSSAPTGEGASPVSSVGGQNLLKALEGLVMEMMHQQKPAQVRITDEKHDNSAKPPATILLKISKVPASPSPPPSSSSPSKILNSEIKSMIQDELRQRIYNKMPIRLLAFDEAGSNIELIDRKQMFTRIEKKVYAKAKESQFITQWDAAAAADSDKWGRTQQKRKTLIEDLVSRHSYYAILSHTWIRVPLGDVEFRDWHKRERYPNGFKKITQFCKTAAKDYEVAFGWMDTVCINKDSSSELDESIRSMYKWYRAAHVCIAHLSDTRSMKDMSRDSWFTRGWTLQELLAPRTLRFYNRLWTELVDSKEKVMDNTDLMTEIRTATSITKAELDLCRNGKLELIPISRRLELAASRQVTREEDVAYSLMGLLGVEIPVAYGEGSERAFFRLMRELLGAKKNLLDVFNYGYSDFSNHSKLIPSHVGLYANRLSIFDSLDAKLPSLLDKYKPLKPIILTHLGVRIPLLLAPALKSTNTMPYPPKKDFFANITLHICAKNSSEYKYIGVDYNLLDVDISRAASLSASSNARARDNVAPQIVTFGILNFTKENNDILIPPDFNFFSIPLDCEALLPAQVLPTDAIKIIPTRSPPVFQLKSASKKDRIPIDKLLDHGMQLVTLYL